MDFSVELNRSNNLEFNLIKLEQKQKPIQAQNIQESA